MQLLDEKKLSRNIELIAEYDFANNKILGSAYAVYQSGVLLEKCYGRMFFNSNEPVTNCSIFRLASMTKPITAVAVLILVDRGLLCLDDTIDKFLPEYKNIKIITTSGDISIPKKLPTIRSILTHTSGIGSVYSKLDAMTAEDKKSLDSSVAFYLKCGLDFEPGTAQMYSGTAAFNVLAKIIEIVANTDYLSFLKKEIFEPCGMHNTTFSPTKQQQEQTVDMHNRVDGKNTVFKMWNGCVFEDIPYTNYLGGAGLVSTLKDYCNFAKMLIARGKIGERQILSEATFNQLCTPQISDEIMPGAEKWGLGVRVITEDSYPYLPKGAFGWSGAYGSHFWIDPINEIFAVFMKNSKIDGGSGNESARNFEKAVYSSF